VKRTFLSNIILLLVLNLVIKPLWVLGVDVGVQRMLGPTDYGKYFDLLSFAFLFMAFVDFGLNNFNNREVSRENDSMPDQLARLGTLKLLLGGGFFILVQVVGRIVGFDESQLTILWGTSAIIFLSSFILFIRSNISGIQWYRADVLMSVLDRTMAIALCGLLLWGGIEGWGMTIERFILVQIIAYTLAIIIGAILLLKKGAGFNVRFDLSGSIQILKRSFPYMLLTLLMVSYHRMDVVMIERMMTAGAKQAGIYAQAYKLLDASVMFAFLFSTLLLPMFSKMLKEREDVQSLVRLAETLMLVPAAILVVGASMYATDLMGLLYIEETAESAAVFPFLILALLPIGATYIYGTLLTAEGNLRTLNLIAAMGALVNIIGNYFMIKTMGLKGAAIMTLLTQMIVCLSQVVYAHRSFGFKFGPRQWRNVIVLLVFLPLWARLNKELFDDWRIEFASYLIVAFAVTMITGLFSVKKLKEVLSMRESVDL